jgi:hypothetical protein
MGDRVYTADRVLAVTTTAGTGAYELAGAVGDTFRTIGQAGGVAGLRYMYSVVDSLSAPSEFEEGEGIFGDGPPETLSRAMIKDSSNSGLAVNWGPGTKYLYLSIHSDRAALLDTDGRLPVERSALGRISQLRADSGVSIPNASNATMTFDVRGPDTLEVIGAGTGPFGSFTIQEDGPYLVNLTMTFAPTSGGGQRYAAILMDGAAIAAARSFPPTASDVDLHVSQIYVFVAGQTIQAQLYQDSGASLVAGGNPRSLFTIAKIGG